MLDTHDPYRPALIDWPTLDEATRDKIVSLPIWDIAVATEGRAGLGLLPARAGRYVRAGDREEGRHILFFVNWVAWHRRNMPWGRRPWFRLKIAAIWICLVWERIDMAKGMGDNSRSRVNNFTLNGSKESGVEVRFSELAALCLAENDRRLAPYDSRLIRPRFVPAAMRLALAFARIRRA